MTTPAWLRVATWNTHVGIALRNGGLAWLMRRWPNVHIWCLQEVTRRGLLIDHVDFDEWAVVPASGYHGRRNMPYVVFRRDRFEFADVEVTDTTAGSRWARVQTTVTLRDKRTGRVVHVDPVHVDPLGKGLSRAHPLARRRHMRQVQAHATAAARRPARDVTIAAGDWNERLNKRLPTAWLRRRSAVGRMAAAGCVMANDVIDRGLVRLDDVAHRVAGHTRLQSRATLSPPVRGNDHHAVIARYLIDPLPQEDS